MKIFPVISAGTFGVKGREGGQKETRTLSTFVDSSSNTMKTLFGHFFAFLSHLEEEKTFLHNVV